MCAVSGTMYWTHDYYVQSVLENIIINIPDVDFIFVKLLHATQNLHEQMQSAHIPNTSVFIKLLVMHINLCHQYIDDIKQNKPVDQTLEAWRMYQYQMEIFLKSTNEQGTLLVDLWRSHCDLIRRIFLCRRNRHCIQEQQLWEQNQIIAQQLSILIQSLRES